ncbi:MAG TPA: toll/interleukin-1 receptor domain-containing protein [Pyrinomonadaceae bacterium]|nr:toll/interleukin-1 receptor domain-containing protein [Pyrinomonadaceae bacterium]
MSQVFVSYSHKQAKFADILKKQIIKAGFTVWMDEDLRAGTEWREEIDEQIRASIAVVVVMTSDGKASEYVTYEWAFAYGAGVRVIPLTFIEPSEMHERLQTLQYRDFRNRKRPWKKLASDLIAAESRQLKIHLAVWGPKSKMRDSTRAVRRAIAGGSVTLPVNRDTFGEPMQGELKELFVVYSVGGTVQSMRVDEHETLEL